MITENLSTLKIHKLTQEQYDRELQAGRVDPSALYLTPDEDNSNIYVQNEEPVDAEDGALWVDMDANGTVGSGGASVFVQDEEPTGADVGTLWLDTDEEGAGSGSGSINSNGLPMPKTAAVGQYIRVSAVDDNGVVTAVEAVDAEVVSIDEIIMYPHAEEAEF